MGDEMFLLRHPDEDALLSAIARVQAPAQLSLQEF
jgi:hypothetical protein